MIEDKRIKIRLYGVHLAYVREHLLSGFNYYCNVVSFSDWLKENVYSDFGIRISSRKSIKYLNEVVKDNFYENIGDWIKEKMRQSIFSSEKYVYEHSKNK